jgi:hypothetical protein
VSAPQPLTGDELAAIPDEAIRAEAERRGLLFGSDVRWTVETDSYMEPFWPDGGGTGRRHAIRQRRVTPWERVE